MNVERRLLERQKRLEEMDKAYREQLETRIAQLEGIVSNLAKVDALRVERRVKLAREVLTEMRYPLQNKMEIYTLTEEQVHLIAELARVTLLDVGEDPGV